MAIACAKLHLTLGLRRENIIMCDSKGVIYQGREKGMNEMKAFFASPTKGRANLERANLEGANLRGATLSYANLYGVNLQDADLSGADLSDADLRSANLTRTNLTNAIMPNGQRHD